MKRFILLSAMTVFIIMTISSCTNNPQYIELDKDMKHPFIVKIYTKKLETPRIAPPLIPLKFGTNQSVTWRIKDNEDLKFTIEFNEDDTPFGTWQFNEENNNSGTVVIDPGEEPKFYKYSVKVEGMEPLDPKIIIW